MGQHGRGEEPRALGIRDVGEVHRQPVGAVRDDREQGLRDLRGRADQTDVRQRPRLGSGLDALDLPLVLTDEDADPYDLLDLVVVALDVPAVSLERFLLLRVDVEPAERVVPLVLALVARGRLRPHHADELDRFRELRDAKACRRERQP